MNLKNLNQTEKLPSLYDKSKGDFVISIYNKKTKKYITLASPQDFTIINEFVKKKSQKKKHDDNNRIQKNIAKNIAKNLTKNKNLTKPKPILAIKITDMDGNCSQDHSILSGKKEMSGRLNSGLIIPNKKKISFKQRSPKEVESFQTLTFPRMDKSEVCGLKKRSKTENVSDENQPNTIEDIKVHANKNIQSIDKLCADPKSFDSYNVFKNNLSTSKNSIKMSSIQSNYIPIYYYELFFCEISIYLIFAKI
jgi:hypothetical protein